MLNCYIIIDTVPIRSDGLYIIQNQPPCAPNAQGRSINMALYKDDQPFLLQPDVGVGNSVQTTVEDKLYICILVSNGSTVHVPECKSGTSSFVTNDASGQTELEVAEAVMAGVPAAPMTEVSQLMEVDLSKYPNGVTVTITTDPVTKQFKYDFKDMT